MKRRQSCVWAAVRRTSWRSKRLEMASATSCMAQYAESTFEAVLMVTLPTCGGICKWHERVERGRWRMQHRRRWAAKWLHKALGAQWKTRNNCTLHALRDSEGQRPTPKDGTAKVVHGAPQGLLSRRAVTRRLRENPKRPKGHEGRPQGQGTQPRYGGRAPQYIPIWCARDAEANGLGRRAQMGAASLRPGGV